MYLSLRKLSRFFLFLTAIVIGSAIIARVTVSAESAPSAATIQIDNFSFTPAEVRVKAGTAITWTNRDDIPHTVVSADEAFKSKALDTDDKFTATLTRPGTYSYFCSIHPKMQGKIVVE
jgi:amicyanin